MVIMKWQRNRRGIGKIGALCLVLALVVTLIMPASAYAAQPDASPSVSGVEIARKTVFGDSGSKGRKWQGQFAGQQLATITGKLGELPKGKERYAIVIGSNYIGSVPSDGQIPVVPPFFLELGYAEDDAEAIAGLLMAYGFDKVIPLVGDAASRRNILNAIDKIGDLEKDGDEVVFFYSGHGARQYAPGCKDRDRGHRGLGVVHEGIVTDQGDGKTVDFLWDEDLAKAFSKFQTDRIVFIFDSCLAGGMTELAGKGRIVCGATTSTGIAAEVGEADGMVINHGLFTFFLLGALSGIVPEADVYDHVPGVPDVTVEEAFNFASYSLIGMTPLIQWWIEDNFGSEIAALWGTPTIVDLFPQDLLLQALPRRLTETPHFREPPRFQGKG